MDRQPRAMAAGWWRALDPRRELLLLALLAAETAALWLPAEMLLAPGGARGTTVPPLALFGVVWIAATVPRLLERFDVWDPAFEGFMIAAVAGSTLVLVKLAAFSHVSWADDGWLLGTGRDLILRREESGARVPVWGLVGLAAIAWWRGRTRPEPSVDAAHGLLRLGTPPLALVAAIRAAGGFAPGDRAAGGAVLVFFAGGLAAVALAKLGEPATEPRRGGGAGAAGLRRAGAALLPVALVVAGSVVALGVLTRDLLETVLWALAPLFWALGIIVRVLILAIALVAFVLVSPLLWLLRGRTLGLPRLRSDDDPIELVRSVADGVTGGRDVPDPIRALVALALLLLLFGGVVRFALRRRRRAADPDAPEREPVPVVAAALAWLRRAIVGILGARPGVDHTDPLADLRGDPRWAHTVAVRDTYARFLTQARDAGAPRPAATTPHEHARLVAPLASDAGDDLALLLARYHAARYGADPATAADADAARTAGRHLARALDPKRR